MSRRIDDLGIGDLKIIQDADYFCFGMDTILLANFVKSSSTKNVIVDLCSGSGIIPIIVNAKQKCKRIYGVELQNEMYELLDENIKMNKLEEKISAVSCDIKSVSSIKEYIKESEGTDKVDIITCNPPYKEIGTGITNPSDVKYIARHEVKCTLEDIFITSNKLLNVGGKLFMVHKPERLSDLICIARKHNLEPKNIRFVYPTVSAKPSIVLVEYSKKGGNELKILPALIEYDENGEYTDEIYELYGIKDRENEN